MGCSTSSPKEFDETMYLTPSPYNILVERILGVNDGFCGDRNIITWTPYNNAQRITETVNPAANRISVDVTDPLNIKKTKAIVIICHGLFEHGIRYTTVAEELTKNDFIVYAIDHVSHGKSGGVRGFIVDWTVMPKDVANLAKLARRENPDLPLFIICHSMGTLITINALPDIPDVVAVVFSGCALVSGPGASSPFGLKFMYPISQTSAAESLGAFMSTIDPKGPLAPIFVEELTTNTDELKTYSKDPRRFQGQVMNKTGVEFLKMNKKAKELLPYIKVPMLVIHGSDDTVCLSKGSDQLYNKSGTPDSEKKLEKFPHLKHEIFFERDGHLIISKAVNYIKDKASALEKK